MRVTNSLDSSLPAGAQTEITFPYEIRFVDMEAPENAREQVEEYLAKLAHVYERIISARVAIRIPHKHGHKRLYHVNIEVDMPGRVISASRDPEISDKHADLRSAIRDAFHKITRQVDGFNKERVIHKGQTGAVPEIKSL